MGPTDPAFRMAGRALAFCFRTPAGPVTVELGHEPQRLDVRTWGPGATWVTPRLPALAGLEDDPDAFRPTHPVVRDLWHRFPGTHLPTLPRIFDRVIQVVGLQLVKSTEGYRSWNRLVREFGEPAPGPHGLTLPPDPDTLAALSDAAFVAHGVPHKQARTMLRVADAAPELEAAAEGGPADLGRLLLGIRGVGPWTVGYVCGTALGDADAVLPGDYHLPHTMARMLAGLPRGDDEVMAELLEPFRGHRFRIVKLVWQGGARHRRTRPRRPDRPIEPFRGS